MEAELDRILRAIAAPPKNTGFVVGVIQNNQPTISGYGAIDAANPDPPRGDTLFEIGSVTKVFTAQLLAILVADGLVSLDDQVRYLVPRLANLPPEITLLRLATHTSGLPRMPSNLRRSMRQDRNNPFAAYTMEELLGDLSRFKPAGHQASAGQIHYSNVGYALLGYLLAKKLGVSYEQAVNERICAQLDMPDTHITLTPDQSGRLATPHKANGKPTRNWDMPAFAGAGAMRSTGNDMLKYLAANLGKPVSGLTATLQACHEIHPGAFPVPGALRRLIARLRLPERDISKYELSMTLGWHVGQLSPGGSLVYWRHGATGGYRAFTGFVKTAGAGVVVLANRGLGAEDMLLGVTSTDRIGFKLLAALSAKT